MMDVQNFIKQQKTAFSELIFHLTEPNVMPKQRYERLGQFKTHGQKLISELLTYRKTLSSNDTDSIKTIDEAIQDLVKNFKAILDNTLKSMDPNTEVSTDILSDLNRSFIPENVLNNKEDKLTALGLTKPTVVKRESPMPIVTPTAKELLTMSQLFDLNLSMKINTIDGEDISGNIVEFIYVINPMTQDGAVTLTRFVTPELAISFVEKLTMLNIEPVILYGKPVNIKKSMTLEI